MELVWPHSGSTVPTLEVQDPVGMDVGVPGHLVEASVDKDPVRDKHPKGFRTGSSVDHLVDLPDDLVERNDCREDIAHLLDHQRLGS